MGIAVIGKVFLDGRQFTTDPHIKRAWPGRRSRLLGIQGSATQQDFGLWDGDMRLTLTSHGGNWMNQDLKDYIDGLRAQRGARFTYSDYAGNDGQVVIYDFEPQPTFMPDDEGGVLWDYTLVLDKVTD